jgi:hypothetical protein
MHPYAYTLLKKYNQPTTHEDLSAGVTRQDLIKYFNDHLDIEGAQEAIDLLGESSIS